MMCSGYKNGDAKLSTCLFLFEGALTTMKLNSTGLWDARTNKKNGGIIMKKLLSLVLALVALTLCMSAAFAEAVDHTQGNPVMIKIAHVSQEGVPIDQGHRLFKEKIEEITGGRITVEVYPAAQLGDNVYLLEQLQFGALEMCSPSVAPSCRSA